MRYSAKSIKRTISALTGTHLPQREAIIVKCLAQGHKCHDRDLNPHSAEQNQQSLNSELLTARPRHPTKGYLHDEIKLIVLQSGFSEFLNVALDKLHVLLAVPKFLCVVVHILDCHCKLWSKCMLLNTKN